MSTELKIGLALGSGSARGWSHIGVIKALSEMGINPAVVCGTSAGALVGASYVADKLDKLEEWALSLTKLDTARFFDITISLNGFVNANKLHAFLTETVADENSVIEDYEKQFAAVATELDTGHEIWLSKGSVIQAVLASMAYPGLFPSVRIENKWMIDGGLVNPVPVSTCRALGADIVIAVNLNSDIIGHHQQKTKVESDTKFTVSEKITRLIKDYTGSFFNTSGDGNQAPGLMDTLTRSINITQDRITRSRMAGDPPEILISPKLSKIGLLELYRAEEAISEGRQSVERAREDIAGIINI